jgi:hypothetical protein
VHITAEGRRLHDRFTDLIPRARPFDKGAARLTGQVIAVDGGFTTVRPLVK